MIDRKRLSRVKTLQAGEHASIKQGASIIEAAAYITHVPWSEEPECVCPVIGSFLLSWNDRLPDSERTALLLPLLPKLPGTRNEALEGPRALMVADWLIRVNAPAWLRLAGLTEQAAGLEGVPEITRIWTSAEYADPRAYNAAMDVLHATVNAAADAAREAGDAIKATRDADISAWLAAAFTPKASIWWAAVGTIEAAREAMDTARAAAHTVEDYDDLYDFGSLTEGERPLTWGTADASRVTARTVEDAIKAVIWATVSVADDIEGVEAAAKAAVKVKLEPTRRDLQTSALKLVKGMIELKEAA